MNKAFILEEIQRTAEANGGLPLGFRKFEQETGIKQSEWLAKFWPRWSEALAEAGFKPNHLKVAYDKTVLLQKYANLAKTLAKLPSANDLRFRTRNGSDFPGQSTFENRFGTMKELIKQVGEHCQGQNGYDMVIRLCEEYEHRNPHSSKESKPKEGQIGFVYLIKSARFYKIGKTNAAGRREREIALQLPEKAAMVHVIRTDDPSGIEECWHKRFAPYRQNGEWFLLSSDDVAAFKRRKFM